MLTSKGKLYGDLTVACMEDEYFILFGSGLMQEAHRRWFENKLPEKGVSYVNRSDDYHGVAISGPKSRELLNQIIRDDVSPESFKFRDIRQTYVGDVPAIIIRMSFSGELGYEIYCKPHYLVKLTESIEEAGKDLGFCWYGARALLSMRLEKQWGVWTLDYRPDFTAAESGLDAFIDWNKDFIGKEPAEREHQEGIKQKLITLTIESGEIDVSNDEAILKNEKPIGYISSGGYAHYVKKSVALGYVPIKHSKPGTELQVEILGEIYNAEVQEEPLYDPDGTIMRG